MQAKPEKLNINGLLILDKPAGISSNRALQIVKRLYNAKKAGYIGTLDPFATGMLPICFGKATKLSEALLNEPKRYLATLKLGISTTTGDTEGQISEEKAIPDLNEASIKQAFSQFTGNINQIPPMYSALKHQGQPLYKLARKGQTIERAKRMVTIYELKLITYNESEIIFEAQCSKGTYIRVLAEDIAKALNTCGHLTALRRLSCAGFEEKELVPMQTIEAGDTATRMSYIKEIGQ